jgi:hypothetical protein
VWTQENRKAERVSNVKKAFRNEILEQTRKTRKEQGAGGQGQEYHVDHTGEKEFCTLLEDFCKKENIELCDVGVKWGRQRPHHFYDSATLDDTALKTKWQSFHELHAVLQVIPAHENLTKPNQRKRKRKGST